MCKSSMELKTVKVYLEDWKELSSIKTETEMQNLADVVHELIKTNKEKSK